MKNLLTYNEYKLTEQTDLSPINIESDIVLKFSKYSNNEYLLNLYKNDKKIALQEFEKNFKFWKQVMKKIINIVKTNNISIIVTPIDFGFSKRYFSQMYTDNDIKDSYDFKTHKYLIKKK